jgi:multiple sugar transport system permease protein
MRPLSRSRAFLGHALLVALSFVFVLPFAWLITTSLQPDSERSKNIPPALVPGTAAMVAASEKATGRHLLYRPTLAQYAKGLTRVPVPLFLRNTVFICALTVFGAMVSCSLAAYAFSILRWKGRDACFFVLLATLMLPAQVTMIPSFMIWKKLHLINSFFPLVVPYFLGVPFYIFLFRQFFLTIPPSFVEAARIDGAGELRIWATIVLPLSVPALATVGLFSFLGAWNDFLHPLIYLADQDNYTLSLGLAMFRTQYGGDYGQMMAVAALMTVPIVALFFFAQKTFIQGIKTSGLKG